MPKIMPRVMGLAAVAAGALAIAGSSVAPVLAASTTLAASTGDTGTATFAEPSSVVASMARAGIVALPGASGTSAYGAGHEKVAFPVTAGNGDVTILHGVLDLGGSLTYIDGVTHKSVTFRELRFSYDTGNVSGITGKAHRRMAIVVASGDFSETVTPGANPSQETQAFKASRALMAGPGARYLDGALRTKHFKAGAGLGSFSATYTFNIPA